MHEDEGGKRGFAGFEDWLTNMFWFHYKWYFIVGVFLLTILVLSVVSFVKNVDYDWTVVYAHEGEVSSEAAKTLTKAFEAVCTDENENGKVQVKLSEVELKDKTGSYSLYGELGSSEKILFVMDQATMELYGSLGYFTDLKYIGSLNLWAGMRDNPVKLYTLEDFQGLNYTQDDIDETNKYRQDEHDRLVARAEEAINKLS